MDKYIKQLIILRDAFDLGGTQTPKQNKILAEVDNTLMNFGDVRLLIDKDDLLKTLADYLDYSDVKDDKLNEFILKTIELVNEQPIVEVV